MMSDTADLIAEARASVEKAHDESIRILNIGAQTRMSIPADPTRDTDLIMVSAFDLSRKALDALEAVTVPVEQNTSAEAQIEELANFIMDNIPGEPSRSEGAVDTAIRLLGGIYGGREK